MSFNTKVDNMHSWIENQDMPPTLDAAQKSKKAQTRSLRLRKPYDKKDLFAQKRRAFIELKKRDNACISLFKKKQSKIKDTERSILSDQKLFKPCFVVLGKLILTCHYKILI